MLYVFSVHFAKTVMAAVTGVEKSYSFVHSLSEYQPPNTQPSSVRSFGFAAVFPPSTVCASGALPWPFALNVTVYEADFFIVTLSADVVPSDSYILLLSFPRIPPSGAVTASGDDILIVPFSVIIAGFLPDAVTLVFSPDTAKLLTA